MEHEDYETLSGDGGFFSLFVAVRALAGTPLAGGAVTRHTGHG